MQLIQMLMYTVAVLTFLSGCTVFFGSNKKEKIKSAWFFTAAIFATTWMVSIALFMIAKQDWGEVINWHTKWTFISAIFLDIAFLGYVAWDKKYGKILTIFFLLAGSTLVAFIFCRPELLYSEIILSSQGNSIKMNDGILNISYIVFFGFIVSAIVISLIKQFIKAKTKRHKSDVVIMISFAISSLITLIADLIIPFFGNWHYIWLGPLALSITIISFYYTILRYRNLNLSSIWLKIFSYIVIASSLAIIYMIIFSIIFAAMFRGATPSTEVVALNFIMILIVILLQPATNELSMYIRSLISQKQIDMLYVIQKLSQMPKGTDLSKVAKFLAEHMHFDYIGIISNGQIYHSMSKNIPDELLQHIKTLKKPTNNIWQDYGDDSNIKESDITAIAAMQDGNGRVLGQMIFGRPQSRSKFNHKDIVKIETIINLTSLAIDARAANNIIEKE